MRIKSYVAYHLAYVAAVAGMVAAILYNSLPGAVVARSYAAYNGRAVPGYADTVYRDVHLPYRNTLVPITAKEARNIQSGILIFAYPACPYCRNLMPELIRVAAEANQKIYYCKIDDYRDRYVYDPRTAKAELVVGPGEGYLSLLDWLGEYLPDYVLSDPEKNEISVGEKRIGAPTIVRVENGEAVSVWKLSSVTDITLPDSKYDTWDNIVQEAVSESLRRYIGSL